MNWFWVTFIAEDAEFQREAEPSDKGVGMSLHVKVDDVDAYYEGVLAQGIKQSSEIQNRAPKTREFSLRDPDGYTLVIFEKR